MNRKILRAVDGDTLQTRRKISGTNYIRLAGVNAPERGQRGYTSAKDRLDYLTKGRVATIVPKARDRYGRIVADVRVHRKKINSPTKYGGW